MSTSSSIIRKLFLSEFLEFSATLIHDTVVLIAKRARAALESSSKRGSFQRISNRQEFWSIEVGQIILEYGVGGFERKKVLSDIRHLNF